MYDACIEKLIQSYRITCVYVLLLPMHLDIYSNTSVHIVQRGKSIIIIDYNVQCA